MSPAPGSGGVEFVCTGNICRSPFAAGVAVSLGLSPGRVHSSGVWADPGRGCPRRAVAAAAEYGVDLAPHRALPAVAEALASRDWVLAMEFGQLAEVRRLLPLDWGGTATLLGAFAPGAGVEIPDPYGGPDEEYRTAYALIRRAVAAWLAVPEDAP
jgi:protein-tyrosine phosphatase